MALEQITVRIAPSGVRFHRVGRWSRSGLPYLIASCTNGCTIKGEMVDPVPGDEYRLWGEWREQKNREHGTAFEFRHYETIVTDSPQAVTKFLSRHIPGVGDVRAKALVAHFGAETLAILRESPARASECEAIPPKIVQLITDYFEHVPNFDPAAYARLIAMFDGQKFPQKLVKALLDDFGSSAPAIIQENPYLLLNYPRMGWKSVDGWAMDPPPAGAGYPHDGIERARAAILEYLAQVANEGHTWVALIDLKCEMHAFTSLPLNLDALEDLISRFAVVRDTTDTGKECYALGYLYHAERGIARHLVRLAATGRDLPNDYCIDKLEGEQIPAADFLSDCPVGILAGGAGTGKSHSTIQMIQSSLWMGIGAIAVVAPTGKAARRDAELLEQHVPDSGIVPKTIHSALAATFSEEPLGVPSSSAKVGRGRNEFGFRHNETETLPANMVVIDEQSMCDVLIMNKFLGALADGTRLLMVGDPNQLPSVQAGAVLRDLIAGGVPTATLSHPRRNAGRIVTACHAILHGETPVPSKRFDLEAGENWIHIEEADPDKIAEIIVRLHSNPNRDPKRDMQVVTAENHKKPIACRNLNALLQEKLNPPSNGGGGLDVPRDDADESPGSDFRVGDKIIRLENGPVASMTLLKYTGMEDDDERGTVWEWQGRDYLIGEIKIVNGDMGLVEDIVEDRYGVHVVVRFQNPNRLCRLPYATAEIALAYAVTAHKAQGSGFPYVIVPVHPSFFWDATKQRGLFHREWLYTALSRAEEALVTVGTFAAIRQAIGRKTVHLRRTRLREFVQEAVRDWEERHGRALWPHADTAANLGVPSR